MSDKKFKMVSYNNRKKQIAFVYTSGKRVTVHYSQLGIKRNISRTWIDRETSGQSVGYEFEGGRVDYMPYDQPLAVARDPEFLLRTHIERLTAKIKGVLKKKKISKRYLAEQLETSDNQIQRLLDPAILNKNLSQLYQIAALLGLPLRLQAA